MGAQNIYDDPRFFAGYAELRRVEGGLNAALEWPAFQRLLPSSLKGMRVLDLGCGMGNFARAARALGAREVIGLDVSERMLDAARAQTADPAISYVRGEIESAVFKSETFDLIASSLAIHYVEDYASIVRRVARTLRPGGRFAFSVEHPMVTCRAAQGWVRDNSGARLYWPVDEYRTEGVRATRWFVDNVIKYHRTTETYVNELIAAGLRLARLEEPEPIADMLKTRPELEADRRRPPFLLLAADLPST